jgi:hypothetical protein
MKHRLLKSPFTRRRKAFTIMRWEFARGPERLSCQIDCDEVSRDDGTFAVTLVPHRSFQRATIEVVQGVSKALSHHALLASGLRAAGWKLVAYN